MLSYFFHHNLDTCIGCGACQVACKDHNGLDEGEFFRRVEQVNAAGTARFYSGACNHCEEPACMAACPNDAYYREADGTVRHDAGRCIGCGRCTWACPYGAAVLLKTRGTASKCDGCYERRMQGLEPACVAACVNRSLRFAGPDAEELPAGARRDLPGVLPDPSITRPRLALTFSAGEKPDEEV